MEEKCYYEVSIDYNGLVRTYTSLRTAKSVARRLAKKYGEGCCANVTADVEQVVMYYKNGNPTKQERKLITSYTF